ncbi:MAG: MerR family transcriptional regulator [Anaerolineales bacterium]|nr:MerR family transcriptional regulator [Anaerolineales bacterium]
MTTPTYPDTSTIHHLNMKAVVRETGIKADTLRAWERRYGIPSPERSKGGHRLYSERDVKILFWLKARQDEGLTIKLAVDQWRQLLQEGTDPFVGQLSRPYTSASGPGVTTVDTLRERWVKACCSFEEMEADLTLSTAFAMFPPEVVCIDLITEGLAQIGELWESGEVSVQQEHFASEIARRKLETLIAASPAPARSGKVLILCPPGEEHSFIPLLITFLLRQSGRAVVFLGANVPVEKLEVAVRSLKPVLVILSASQLISAASMFDLLQVLHNENVLSAFGGSMFVRHPRFITSIPAHYLGDNLKEVVGRVESLIANRPSLPGVPVNAALTEAGVSYSEKLMQIEQKVWEKLQSKGQTYTSIAALSRFMSEHIFAMVNLGVVGSMGLNRGQFLNFLRISGFPMENLEYYLDAYINVLVEVLGEGVLISQAFLPLRRKEAE